MKAILSLPRRSTYADYLAAGQHSESRLEFLDGVIVAMAGGSDEHNAIAFRFSVLFGVRLAPGCHGYTADQRFWVAATTRARYSDGSIICGKPSVPRTMPRRRQTLWWSSRSCRPAVRATTMATSAATSSRLHRWRRT